MNSGLALVVTDAFAVAGAGPFVVAAAGTFVVVAGGGGGAELVTRDDVVPLRRFSPRG